MKYLITGATGFIGTNLSLKLANEGHQVNALVRDKEKAKPLDHPNITFYFGDIHKVKIIEEALQGVHGIFHLAAFAKPWAKDSGLYNKINAEATKSLFQIARKKAISKIIFTSTAGTFGPSVETPVDEETVRQTDFFNEYESTKFIAEKITKDFVLKGMDIVIVHPTRVYGPGLLSKSNAVTFMIKQYINGNWRIIPGNGKRIGNYAYIDDIVNGHILAMQNGRSGEQYLIGGEDASYEYFFKLLRTISENKHTLIKIPVSLLIGFSSIQATLARMVGKAPLLPPKWVKKYLYDWSVNSTKAINELGYQITPLNEGLKKTLEWLKQEKL
jgi:farnesol dehydrogenase